jgi:hypothetical protein
MENFSTNAVCLILASMPFAERDYIRDFEAYRLLQGHDPT